jgi:hypothetical protein
VIAGNTHARCDVCLEPLPFGAVSDGRMRHPRCADVYMQDFAWYNARAVREGLDAERQRAWIAEKAHADAEKTARTTESETSLPDNGVIGVATGIGVTGLATFDNSMNWTTASAGFSDDPWPFPREYRAPTRDQLDLLGVLHDLVTEYAQAGGPLTALLDAVRDAYRGNLR